MQYARNIAASAIGAILVLGLSACVAGSGEAAHAASGGAISQILLGFWHGVIAPLTLLGEIITHFAPHLLPWHVGFYETKAAGAAYDFGFFIGLAGGPSVLGSRWRRRG